MCGCVFRVEKQKMNLKKAIATFILSGSICALGVVVSAPPVSASVSAYCASVGATQVGSTQECLKAFTATGSTTWTLPSGITTVRYLVVGGGGAGQQGYASSCTNSRGGAGGSILASTSASVQSGATLSITIGAGGSQGGSWGSVGTSGGSSSLSGGGLSVTASGGATSVNNGAGTSGPLNDITGTSLNYGSGGGRTGSGNGAGHNQPNRGGGGAAGSYVDFSFGSCTGPFSASAGEVGQAGVVYIRFAAAVAPSVTGSNAPTGSTQVGSTLTSATTYNAVPAPSMTYQWQSSSDGTNWTDVSGANASTFVPTADQVNQFIRVRTTATNDSGTANDDSPSVGPITVPATGTPSVATASDLGDSNSDSITSDTTPTMEATGLVVGATVSMTATNGSDTVTCTFVATSTTGGCSLPELSDGTWSVTSSQSLNGVSSTPSPARSVSIDSTPPGVPTYSFTSGGSPLSNGGATSSNSISLASGPTSSGSSSISCSLNGGPRQTPCPSTFSPLVSGANNIAFTAVDAAGNETTDTFSFNYLGQSSASLATSSDTGVSNSDRITSDNTPQIDVGGLVLGAQVTVTASNGGLTESCTFTATASTGSCSLPELSDGSWSIASVQTLGGSSTSPSTPVNISVDTQSPSAPGAPTAIPTGGTPVANQISAATTGVSLSASIAAGEATGGRAEFYLNGVLVGTDSSISAGDTSVTVSPNLADLTASGDLTVQLFDAAGNSIAGQSSTPVSVDRTVPAVNSFVPSTGQSLNTATDPLSFDLVMSEPISGLTGSDFTNAGTATGCVFTPSASSGTSFRVTVTGCSAGTVLPQLNAGSITDGVNSGPATNMSVSGANGINFITTAPTGTGVPTLTASTGSMTTLGSTLVSSAGSWNDQGDSTATTSYRWQVCTDPADVNSCTDISGATGSSFVPTASLDGAYIRSVTTRTNAAGTSTSQASVMTGPMSRGTQTVTFAGPSTQTFSTDPIALGGTSSSGLALTYTSLTPTVCTTSGAQVTMLSSGTCTVEASHPGDGMFLPATPVQQSFTVNRASQNVAITTPTQAIAVGSSISLAATAPGGGAITYAVTSGGAFCSVTGSTLLSTGVGDCTVEATIAQDGPYLTATSTPVTFQARTGRTASLNVPNGALLSDGSVDVVASLSDGSAPTITAGPSTVCRASGTKIELIGIGECSVSATASANATHTGAESGVKVFRVGGPPSAPVINGVRINGGNASVDIRSGAQVGAAAVADSYTVTATPRGGGAPITVTCTTLPCIVPGLKPGETYDFSAVAHGLVGEKQASSTATSYGPVIVGALPQDVARLDQTPLNFGAGWVTATARLKNSQAGRVSHVMFMVRNSDGTTARTVRVKVPPNARRVSTRIPRLTDGQRIVTFVENDFGVSRKSPKRRNVIQGPTANGRDTAGQPQLMGESLLVDRIIFDPASPMLDTRDREHLTRLARELRGRGGLLLISGFARQNLIDSSKFLTNLSIERARNVANYLSSQGVRAWIRFDGYGAITSSPGIADDRRVEIRWSSAGR